MKGNSVCGYQATDRTLHILKEGQLSNDIVYAVDKSGKTREIAEVATCRKTQQGLGIGFTWTLGGQPVLLYNLAQSSAAALAVLQAGESVQDTFIVYRVDQKVKNIPVTITCVKRGGTLGLQAIATLDGQPVEFYADAQQRWFALKRGEHVPGTSKINAAEKRKWRS